MKIYLPDLIGKGYAGFWNTKKRYRVLKGGRRSKKSSTTAMGFIYNLMKYKEANLLCIRKTLLSHKDSTYAELKKACLRFNVLNLWKFTESPLEAKYYPTGQKILFKGFDDAFKLTSINVDVGVICWVWLEEACEIKKESDFDTLDESIIGKIPDGLWKQITLTYNPWYESHWTNKRFWDCECPEDVFRLTTTHKCNEFLDEEDHKKIEDLANTNPERYRVVGLGEYGRFEDD